MSPLLLQSLCILLLAGEVVLIGAQSAGGGGGGDKEVLVELKRFLVSNNKVNRGGYDGWQESDPSPCGWKGVTCDGGGRVSSLNLTRSTISGPVFGGFSRLPALTSLDLSDNSITGALPAADLNQCRGLLHLNLSHNLITGPLVLSGLTRLRVLDVSGNRLDGAVAVNFPAICADLTLLDLSTNNLTGSVTGLLDGCARLDKVDLSSNNFTGELWPGIARFREFSAAENNLTGSVPWSTFPDGCRLQSLDLSANQLVGGFPDSIANCTNLTYMSLWGNNFTGKIPAGIGKLAVLETLILGKNKFDRQIPPDLTNCGRLQFLDISSNMFGGDVQQIFGNFTSLKYLVLHHNEYTGGIVASGVLRLPLLARLDLSFNQFTGQLPPQVADMKSLKYLMLAENNFSGTIPPEYGRLAELQALDLSNNTLSGVIPATIGNLTSLLWLMLAGNQLSGQIPPEIGNCTSLLWLNLADNLLTGRIPPEMAEIGRNPGPTFAKNRNDTSVLAGSGECQAMKRWIPASYPPFSFVYSVMTRESCRTIWDRMLKGYGIVPICTNSSSPVRSNTVSGYVQLSGNLLSGQIPSEIGAMRNLSLLHLDGNRLTGQLPAEIGRLPLVMLNVSRNNLSGPIPSEIGDILCIERMDLSFNNLSGELPASLFKLTELSMFNVSYNPLLSGNVSTTGQFGTFDEQSFLGNPLISLHQGGAAGKQQPPRPEAADAPGVRTGGIPRTIVMWLLFSLVIAFIAGTVVFAITSLRARFPVDQEPEPDSFSCEHSKGKYAFGLSSSPPSGSSSATGCSSSTEGVKVFRLDKTAFTYRDIVAATGNFSDDRVIGRGGSGVVYRGVLPDGRAVAVKKLSRPRDGVDGDSEREFRAEMEVLADRMGFTWPHPNLVTLYGWCLSGGAKILVYERLDGGSLEALICDTAAFGRAARLDAAVGVARALAFLHHECVPAVVHRDVKASNVLLDGEGRAKVTDFGLARVVRPGDTHVSTMVAGTVGYVAPEYAQTWRATTKGDVYSYGVLLMELATGRRAVDGGEECLVDWTRRTAKEGRKQQTEDQKTAGGTVSWELLALGMRCTADAPHERPDMPDVLAALLDIAGAANGDAGCAYCRSSEHSGGEQTSSVR
ncbi:putative LRR receptor-like serine/threonine-protein kinase [Hordeum vulgare]|uniref:non-specific serine/threonine protein kinase n=1 Tax=Hordeum vulgare subsp. vulgare TaxID=112509 RepID=A0A8I6WQB5_HORVV|nr:probable LRR receptor-like serine/threonine-protein kinase At1g74360 [Hordeum vulgare subsp. vulgare]KAE8780341.1 putative LRR receptor-like serine/threonine-protein kinase [Hordeum vulgare]